MIKEENMSKEEKDFSKLLDENTFVMPQVGELIKGEVITASRAEVRLDIDGIVAGVVRGPELYEEDDDYANLQSGDTVEATVIEGENENGDLELSFRFAGQEKAWVGLREAFSEKSTIKIKVIDANKGGLLVKYRQIPGFLPVSQLAPENYPRVNGGDKGKILDKLRSFAGSEFEVKVMTLDEREDKIIFSEKEAWNERQKDVISKYQVGTIVEGEITAITDFGVFISFGENLEGLIHISELAWQRIDDPAELYKVGDKIDAEVISLENSKIFLSAKKLIKDPWEAVNDKYKIGQVIEGLVLKVNPFGLFVKLDEDIHGLAHISQLNLAPKQRINEKFNGDETLKFEIVSIEPKAHRLGLSFSDGLAELEVGSIKEPKKVEKKEVKKVEEVKEEIEEEEKSEAKEEVKEEKAEKVEEVKKETKDAAKAGEQEAAE